MGFVLRSGIRRCPRCGSEHVVSVVDDEAHPNAVPLLPESIEMMRCLSCATEFFFVTDPGS